ncbi:MAG: DNA mismatch repair endonuclease MutL, partial [Bacteroidetes bacterium]|nr:DNA mismatch repair endonuclease MutL [Bacteroidota bacterium]
MSNSIKILPQHLYNKIAAGEVVGRPESVVKELAENSIDAGATEITVIIRDAGKTLISVIDNGSGMSEEDAKVAFLRHSTSKIATYEDLENIHTLGFRGEALASIAAISQVELKTKRRADDVGTLIRIEGNEVMEVSKTTSETGTSVAVKNIFYNTPGRRNFLKSNQTEFRHIYDTFVRLAISNPSVEFRFYNNDELIFDLKPATLQLRLQEIFGKDFADSLIVISTENSLVKLNGFITRPGFTKKAKQDQFFYLNKRFFTNKNLNFAVYSGYDDLIEKGDYPSFFLFIEIDPHKVDVNVHPSKLEVKFEDEGAMFGFIRKTVRDTLRSSNITFDMTFGSSTASGAETLEHTVTGKLPDFDFSRFRKPSQESGGNIHSIFQASRNNFSEDTEKSGADYTQSRQEIQREEEKNIFEHTRKDEERFNIWQYQNKYIMCETETGLMIIDQHAAHERILYEKASARLNSQSAFSQQLLMPIGINLTKIDYQIAKSLEAEIA